MRISMLFLFLYIFRAVGATCPCDGITLDGSDQEHCWQVQSRTGSTWGEADDSCVAVGGHLGHPSDSNYVSIVSFVQKESSLPVLTGIVAGNTEIPVIGAMCQDNGFYGVIANTTGLIQNAPTSTATCTYIKSSASGLVFDSCSIDANVLCDRPLEKQDYCSIMANCSSTTTWFSTTTGISSSTTSANVSSTSPTTQSTSYSSSTTGETSSFSTTTTSLVSQSSISSGSTGSTGTAGSTGSTSTGSTGGSGSGPGVTSLTTTSATCQCPTNGVTTTTTTTSAPAGSCAEQTGCLKHQWKILGMCVDWRAMLALLGILLGIFLCCCICHCCMHACMFCTPRRKEQVRPLVAPVPLPLSSSKMDYDVEKSDVVVLPPPAVQPEPVFITVPEKHESVYGFHTKEIIHVMPEKPATKDVATMTDSTDGEHPAFMPVPVNAPVMKRKKAVKKPKKMFIPATADPIEEDVAAEIPIDVPDSPGARSVAPLGDTVDPVPMIPLNFSRNPKPFMPEPPKLNDDIPPPQMPRQNQSSNALPPSQQRKPNVPSSDNEEFDPSGLRSPPIPPSGKANDRAAPRRMTFSPIADDSEEETGARIPSPPREPKGGRPGNGNRGNNGSGLSPNSASSDENRPTLKNQRLNEMPSPTPAANAPASAKSPAKSPVAPSSGGGSNNPFANLGGASPASGGDGGQGGPLPGDDVGMRAARGKLGGAVRGGGGGGEAPNGWKPWAKGGGRR